jgi:phytoene synthase
MSQVVPPDATALAVRPVPAPEDLAHCRRLLAAGSKSFSAAARALPRRIRDAATVVYAFCRVADDAVDDSGAPDAAVVQLTARLDRMWSGHPDDTPVDRALWAVVRAHAIPRAPFDALLEGFAWDARGRDYEDLGEVLAYAARVASAVGVVMTYVMGVRDPVALARACDLGAAMQLTNICRDVGEDARRGRLYLPRQWMREAGLDPDAWLAAPRPHAALATVIERLLVEADALYVRGRSGIPYLPADCRPAIRAAGLIYADIGRCIRDNGHDAVDRRAHTSGRRKLWLWCVAWIDRRDPTFGRQLPPLPQTAFLVAT